LIHVSIRVCVEVGGVGLVAWGWWPSGEMDRLIDQVVADHAAGVAEQQGLMRWLTNIGPPRFRPCVPSTRGRDLPAEARHKT
jgi:hypothetical protein